MGHCLGGYTITNHLSQHVPYYISLYNVICLDDIQEIDLQQSGRTIIVTCCVSMIR